MTDRIVIRNGEASSQDPNHTSAWNTDANQLPGPSRDLKEAYSHQGAIRIGVNDAGYDELRPTNVTIKSDSRLTSADQLNFQTPYGSNISDLTRVTGSDFVQVGGTWTTVAAALKNGLITRQGAGYFVPSDELKAITAQEVEKQNLQAQQYSVDFLSSDYRKTMNDLKGRMGSSAFDGAMALIVQEMMKPEGDASRYLAEISNQAQVDGDSLLEFAEEAINEAFSNGIEFVAHQYGIDPEIAVEFALKNWSSRVRGQFVVACLRNNMADIKQMAFAMKNRDRY